MRLTVCFRRSSAAAATPVCFRRSSAAAATPACFRRRSAAADSPMSKALQMEVEYMKMKIENAQLRLENEQLHDMRKHVPLTCPITLEPIRELVVCASDGYFYERSAIESWHKLSAASPMTNGPIKQSDLHGATNLHSHLVQIHAELSQLKAEQRERSNRNHIIQS
jgi:regulator of replication initiation timing